jgi:hypothetical protein
MMMSNTGAGMPATVCSALMAVTLARHFVSAVTWFGAVPMTRRRMMSDVLVGHEIEPSLVYQDANVKVTAVENTHFHTPEGSPYAGKYKSYSPIGLRRPAA